MTMMRIEDLTLKGGDDNDDDPRFLVWQQKDSLVSILEFLDWRNLVTVGAVSLWTFDCTKTAWSILARQYSLEDESCRKYIIAYIRSKEMAKKMESLSYFHSSRVLEQVSSLRCLGCSEMPPMLALDGLIDPTRYAFFVRFSQLRQPPFRAQYDLVWNGFLPFRTTEPTEDYGGSLRRCVSCNLKESRGGEILERWDCLKELLRRDGSYHDHEIASEDFMLGLAITVVACPKREALVPKSQVGVPRLLVSAFGCDGAGGDFDRMDGRMEFDMSFQHVATHEYGNTGTFGSICVSLCNDNRELKELKLQYFVQSE